MQQQGIQPPIHQHRQQEKQRGRGNVQQRDKVQWNRILLPE